MKRRTRKKWLARERREERRGVVWCLGYHLRWTAEASPFGEFGGYKWPSFKPTGNGWSRLLFGPGDVSAEPCR